MTIITDDDVQDVMYDDAAVQDLPSEQDSISSHSLPSSHSLMQDLSENDKAVFVKAAKLHARGISERSICTVCGVTPEELHAMMLHPVFLAEYEKQLAVSEKRPRDIQVSIEKLEEMALAQTIYNISSSIVTPEFTLDALKYATKTRLEQKKQEQDKHLALNANTQIVINMSEHLRQALAINSSAQLSSSSSSGRVIDIDSDKYATINGLSTEELVEKALGQPAHRSIEELKNTHPVQPFTKYTTVSFVDTDDLDDVLVVGGEPGA